VIHFSNDVRRLFRFPLISTVAGVLALIMHCCNLLLAALIAGQLGPGVSMVNVLLLMPTIMLAAALPVSIGGWGAREAGFVVGFSFLGVPASVAVATSIIIGLANFVSAGPGAVAWLFKSPFDRAVPDPHRQLAPAVESVPTMAVADDL